GRRRGRAVRGGGEGSLRNCTLGDVVDGAAERLEQKKNRSNRTVRGMRGCGGSGGIGTAAPHRMNERNRGLECGAAREIQPAGDSRLFSRPGRRDTMAGSIRASRLPGAAMLFSSRLSTKTLVSLCHAFRMSL